MTRAGCYSHSAPPGKDAVHGTNTPPGHCLAGHTAFADADKMRNSSTLHAAPGESIPGLNVLASRLLARNAAYLPP